MNKCFFIGNITRDIEMRFSQSGMALASLSLAINERRKDKEGNPKDKAIFLDMTAFGKTAEAMAQYLKKGSKIAVEASADRQEWDDKQTGQKRSKICFLVNSFEFCDSKGKEQGGPEGEFKIKRKTEAPQDDAEAKPVDPDADADLPF